MADTTYNGWKNRETWLVNVHYEPTDQADLDSIRADLEEQEEHLPPFFRDFVDLSKIDWEELASYLDDEAQS